MIIVDNKLKQSQGSLNFKNVETCWKYLKLILEKIMVAEFDKSVFNFL